MALLSKAKATWHPTSQNPKNVNLMIKTTLNNILSTKTLKKTLLTTFSKKRVSLKKTSKIWWSINFLKSHPLTWMSHTLMLRDGYGINRLGRRCGGRSVNCWLGSRKTSWSSLIGTIRALLRMMCLICLMSYAPTLKMFCNICLFSLISTPKGQNSTCNVPYLPITWTCKRPWSRQ